MANYSNLKAAIAAAIKQNGNQEITGQVLQDVLTSMVSVIGANYTFAGVATPATNPGTPDQNVFYLAMEGGTYTNFGATALPEGISLLMWNGSWTAKTIMYNDGGVFDISVYKSTGGTLAKFADLGAALGTNGANIPAAARKGGMSVKFVQSSDNKYVQYRLMADAWSTVVTYWSFCGDDVLVENPEWIYVLLDAEKRILAGLKSDGSVEWSIGVPTPVKIYIDNAISEIKNGTEETDLDGLNKIIAFLSEFSTSDTLKDLLDTKVDKEEGKSLIPTQYIQEVENPEFISVLLDSENKIILAAKADGTIYFGAGCPQQIIDYVKEYVESKINESEEDIRTFLEGLLSTDTTLLSYLNETYGEYIDNPEFLEVELDDNNKILSGRKVDGTKFENNDVELNGNATVGGSLEVDGVVIKNIEDPEGRHEITLDTEEKIVSYRKEDGTLVENVGISSNSFNTQQIKVENDDIYINIKDVELDADIIYRHYIDAFGNIVYDTNGNQTKTLFKYKVEEGQTVKIQGDVWQQAKITPYAFYSDTEVYNENTLISLGHYSNVIKETAAFEFFEKVPEGAVCLLVSCRVTNHAHVYLQDASTYSTKESVLETSKHKEPDIAYFNQEIQPLIAMLTCNEAIDYQAPTKKFCFAHISDTHGEPDATERMVQLMTSKSFDMVDLVIHTGDSNRNDYYYGDTSDELKNLIANTDKPILFVPGNHDIAHSPNNTELFNKWIKPMIDKGTLKEGCYVNNKLYYYYDVEGYHIRFICINEFEPLADGNWSLTKGAVTQAQCDWFINTLLNTPSNYHIIVATHPNHHFSTIDENWSDAGYSGKGVNSLGRVDGSPMLDIMKAFVNRATLNKTYNYIETEEEIDGEKKLPVGILPIEINADFSSASAKLAFKICGHTHADIIAKDAEEFPEIIQICNGGGSRKRAVNRIREAYGKSADCFNVITINKGHSTAHVFKIGCTYKKDLTECRYTSFVY